MKKLLCLIANSKCIWCLEKEKNEMHVPVAMWPVALALPSNYMEIALLLGAWWLTAATTSAGIAIHNFDTAHSEWRKIEGKNQRAHKSLSLSAFSQHTTTAVQSKCARGCPISWQWLEWNVDWMSRRVVRCCFCCCLLNNNAAAAVDAAAVNMYCRLD